MALATFAVLLVQPGAARAQSEQDTPGKINLEAAELQVLEVTRQPVLAGASQVGVVHDIALGADGRVDRIRVRTPSRLGLGERIIEVAAPAFTIRGGAVVLELSAEEVELLPAASDAREEGDR
jgi:hypothetical protein